MFSASDSGWGNMLPLRSCLTCSIWGQQQQCGSENWKSDEVKSESDLLLQKLFKYVAMHWQTFLPYLLINSISLIACHPGNPRVVISRCRRKRKTSSSGPCRYHKTLIAKKRSKSSWGPRGVRRSLRGPTDSVQLPLQPCSTIRQTFFFFKSWSKIGWSEKYNKKSKLKLEFATGDASSFCTEQRCAELCARTDSEFTHRRFGKIHTNRPCGLKYYQNLVSIPLFGNIFYVLRSMFHCGILGFRDYRSCF